MPDTTHRQRDREKCLLLYCARIKKKTSSSTLGHKGFQRELPDRQFLSSLTRRTNFYGNFVGFFFCTGPTNTADIFTLAQRIFCVQSGPKGNDGSQRYRPPPPPPPPQEIPMQCRHHKRAGTSAAAAPNNYAPKKSEGPG